MKPRAVKQGLVVQEVNDKEKSKVLVYDLRHSLLHSLTAPAAAVWRLCNGRRSIEEIAETLESESYADATTAKDLVRISLDELGRAGLLEKWKAPAIKSPRRAALKQIASLIAVTTIAAPLIGGRPRRKARPIGSFD